MADKDFKVKNGIDIATPLPINEGGTGQTSASNALNALLPVQTNNSTKVLQTDGTNTTWVSLPNGYQKGNTASRPGSPALGDIYSNTQTGYIEVYTAAGWSQLGVIPTAATIGTATDVGTNIVFGSGAATVAFTPGSGGGLPSSFTAISNPGSITGTSSSSPVTVSGLTQGTSYTFTVTATNGYGNALASSSSNSITATSLPQAPTIGTATNPSNTAYGSVVANLSFTPGANGGKSITNYKYSLNGTTYTAFSPPQTSSPLSITGLSAGSTYSFRLIAVNANGDSLASSTSNSVTVSTVPQAPTIGTATKTGSVGAVSVSFTPNDNGGSGITGYTVTSSPGGIVGTGSSSPIIVSGLTPGSSYTFSVTATNANGTSLSSSSSNSISAPQSVLATYTSNATWINPGISSVEVLVVAGGGGGMSTSTSSYAAGPGGGGGGVIYNSSYSVSGNQSIVIGGGGAVGRIATTPSSNGGNTSFGALTAIGGGGGSGSGENGKDGGSGGGSSYNTGGAATPGQGNVGGSGVFGGASSKAAGGGGGAGSAGSNGSGNSGGSGGFGAVYMSTTVSSGGGGGGGTSLGSTPSSSYGGGGFGANQPGTTVGTVVNRDGSNGTAGVVILRYIG